MLEGAAQILEHTNCLGSGGVCLLPCSPCAHPQCYCLCLHFPHCRHPESGLEPSPKELEGAEAQAESPLKRGGLDL